MSEGWPRQLERGVAGLAHVGEGRSGDVAVFAATAAGGLAACIDGLGHGDAAADAAEAAAVVLGEFADEPPQPLLDRCHEKLRRTRGAVMTLAWFDLERGELAWTGVGNVEGRLVRGAGGADEPLRLAGRPRRRRGLQPAAGPHGDDRARGGRRRGTGHRRRQAPTTRPRSGRA